VEKALIDVQYKYPEVRCTAHSQSTIVERFDISYKNKENGVLTTEDSIWLSNPLKDYYRHWNGYKVFVLSSLDKKFLYEIRLLNEDENKCLLGVVFSSLKNEDGYIGISEPKHYLRDSAIKVFEADILPKINNLLGNSLIHTKSSLK
jgi:hypothetical protein